MKKLSKAAQVSKLLKAKAKSLGLEVRASSKNFSGGNSVDIKVLKGSDKSFNELKEYSSQFKEGHFDGMNDIYEYSNSRDDIPQTKYLFIDDDRASEILKYYDENIWKTEKKWMWFDNELRSYEWIKQIKDEFKNDWQKTKKKGNNEKIYILRSRVYICGKCICNFRINGTSSTSNTRGDIMETITKIKVIRILKNHGHNNYNELKDFIKDLGNKEIYKLQQVKDWLGY
jgi:hypothetical protein